VEGVWRGVVVNFYERRRTRMGLMIGVVFF